MKGDVLVLKKEVGHKMIEKIKIKKVTLVINYYDMLLQKIGSSNKDALKIRTVLKKRLDIK